MLPAVSKNLSTSSEVLNLQKSEETKFFIMETTTRRRIPSNINEMRLNGHFNDCILLGLTKPFKCARLPLAFKSKWFYNYFKQNPIQSQVQEVCLPIDPLGKGYEFFEFIYSEKSIISRDNIVPFLKCSEVYGFERVSQILRLSAKELLSHIKPLDLCKQYIDAGLISDAMQLSHAIAPILRASKREKQNEIFSKLDPFTISAILKDEVFDDLSNSTKISVISRFISQYQKPLSLEEKNALASAIQWNNEIHRLFSFYNFDWAPANIIRPFLIQSLRNKRQSINDFENDIGFVTDPVINRWYPFMWTAKISGCILPGSSEIKQNETENDNSIQKNNGLPECDLVSSIATLGGFTRKIVNAAKYGLINFSATDPVVIGYGVENLFESGRYYWGGGPFNRDPKFQFTFGQHAHILFTGCGVDCCIPGHRGKPNHRPPTKILIESEDETQLTTLQISGYKGNSSIDARETHSGLIFRNVRETSWEMCFRLNSIEVRGRILPCSTAFA